MNTLTKSQKIAVEALWAYYEENADLPSQAFENLSFEDGLAIQVEIRKRRLEAGGLQIGWKVGLTSDRARKSVGIDDRPFGHLMRIFPNGSSLTASSVNGATIEPEMCFTIGERIAGNDVKPGSVPSKIVTVAAGYELNEKRAVVGGNISMLVADNLTNWAIVEGTGTPIDKVEDIDATQIIQRRNNEEVFQCTHRQEVDNPFLSIARLAATLDRFGLAIEPGQKVITGAYTRYTVNAGETWTAEYSGIGQVEMSYT